MTNSLPKKTTRYRGIFTDSDRWADFKHRSDDIFVCTPPKCGTTWTQAICALLIFQTPELEVSPASISPWIDAAFSPIEDVLALLESQSHRRIIKTHTPLDGIPYFEDCQYICVYRDPRDVYFSLRSHLANIKLDIPKDILDETPQEGFRNWIVQEFTPGRENNAALGSLVHHLKSFQHFQKLPNIEFYHYDDLSRDLTGQMQRMADQLGIQVDADLLPELAEAASFDNMKKNAQQFAPDPDAGIWHDSVRFFNKGTSGQWRDVISQTDDQDFKTALAAQLDPETAKWLIAGGDS